eukprot:m.78624 g.78624  ORF g.78624 m.78624 type:complete len:92 (-) comp12679_c0_seq2:1098-1373(-)
MLHFRDPVTQISSQLERFSPFLREQRKMEGHSHLPKSQPIHPNHQSNKDLQQAQLYHCVKSIASLSATKDPQKSFNITMFSTVWQVRLSWI